MSGQLICLVFAFVLFTLGASSRWWPSTPPYYPTLVSAGLAFWVLASLLPLIKYKRPRLDASGAEWEVSIYGSGK